MRALGAGLICASLAVAAACNDFDAAYEECHQTGRCGEATQGGAGDSGAPADGGADAGGSAADAGGSAADAGSSAADSGTAAPDAGEGGGCDASLCPGQFWSFTSKMFAIWGVSPSEVWLVGDFGSAYRWDGKTWVSKPIAHLSGSQVLSVWGASANEVWASGDTARVARWNGAAWAPFPTPTEIGTSTVRKIYGSAAEDVWMIGNNGLIMTVDGGAMDLRVYSTAYNDLHGLWVSEGGAGWAVGTQNTVFTREDGGWTPTAINTGNFTEVWGVAEDLVYATDTSGRIWNWDGQKWAIAHLMPGGRSISGLHGTGPNDIFVAGREGQLIGFDGTDWTEFATGLDAGYHFNSMWVSPTDVWLSGFTNANTGFAARFPRGSP